MNFPGGPMDVHLPQPIIHFPNLPPPLNMLTPQQFMQMYPFPFPGQNPAPAPPAAIIQPDLDTAASPPPASDTGTVQSLNASKSGRRHARSMSGSDAEDEDEAVLDRVKRRKTSGKRKKLTEEKILSKPVKDLSTKQKKTRKELQVCMTYELTERTGTAKRARKAKRTVLAAASNTAGVAASTFTPFDYENDVDHPINARIVTQAAMVIFREQTDPEHSTLTHQTVKWTKRDLVEFGKAQFRTWRSTHQTTTDLEKKAASEGRDRVNKRNQRRVHLANDRLKAKDRYIELHNVDPTPFIDEAWMTDQVSGIETDDEEKKSGHLASIRAAAGLTEEDIEDRVEVFERVQWAFRSELVNDMMVALDGIRREQRRLAKGKPHPQTKRIDLSRRNLNPPTVTVFPCMVDSTWYEDHVSGTLLEEDLELYEEDPEGFRESQPPQQAATSEPDNVDNADRSSIYYPSSPIG